ncbi:MAG: CIA30 family protein [Anaerolineaceae bacterium]|nr:CIA30 family protein [Anaerolineaceae bacterium]
MLRISEHIRFRSFTIILVISLCWLFLPINGIVQAQSTNGEDPYPPTEPVKLIFIHHSTGENWLADGYGDLGIMLANNNYFVSDTNYGWGPDGIGDRTDIVNWPEWFGPQRSEQILTALFSESNQHADYSRNFSDPGGENEIVIFKSCFPNSDLYGDPTDGPDSGSYDFSVGSAKHIYIQMLDYFITQPDKMFVAITAPPLLDKSNAANARAFNNWLVQDWLSDYTGNNVFVFDFYNILTDPDNHHRFHDGSVEHINDQGGNTLEYGSGWGDEHPNEAGSQKATQEFVPLLNVYYHRWKRDSGVEIQSESSEEATEEVEESQPEEDQGEEIQQEPMQDSDGFLDSFLTDADEWYADMDGSSTVNCQFDPQRNLSQGGSLQIDFRMGEAGWGGCGHYFDMGQDWSQTEGITFSYQADQSDMKFNLLLATGEESIPYLYEVISDSSSVESWQTHSIPWEDFVLAVWADASNPQDPDLTKVTGLSIAVDYETGSQGKLWIDEISLGLYEQPDDEVPEMIVEDQVDVEEENEDEDEGSNGVFGVCPFSLAFLPFTVFGIILVFRHKY